MLLASECSPLERKFNSVPRPPTKNPAFWQGLIGALATPAGMAHAAGVISPNGRFRGGLHPLGYRVFIKAFGSLSRSGQIWKKATCMNRHRRSTRPGRDSLQGHIAHCEHG